VDTARPPLAADRSTGTKRSPVSPERLADTEWSAFPADRRAHTGPGTAEPYFAAGRRHGHPAGDHDLAFGTPACERAGRNSPVSVTPPTKEDVMSDGDGLLSLGPSPLTSRILDRLAFIMATAEEVSVLVDSPGVEEDTVRRVTDVLVAVYAQADDLMRRLSH
jgi:hypothetical protein